MLKKKIILLLPILFLIGCFSFVPMYNGSSSICYAATNNVEADEFISYWKTDIRGQYPDICTMPKEKYNELYLKYVSLTPSAKSIVDSTIDVDGYTIKDTMTMLINKYSPEPVNKNMTFDKDTTLTIIIVVGVIGMTSICCLYYLKTKNVIQ